MPFGPLMHLAGDVPKWADVACGADVCVRRRGRTWAARVGDLLERGQPWSA